MRSITAFCIGRYQTFFTDRFNAGCPGRIFPSVQRSMLIGAFWSPPGVVVMQAT